MIYVIKTKNGEFVEQNKSNSKELNYVRTCLIEAEKFSKTGVDILKERFKGTWREDGFEVYKVNMTIERV